MKNALTDIPPTPKIGYARVSTDEQSLDLQMIALRRAGCGDIFTDQGVSGVKARRPGLDQVLDALTPGAVLVVWRLDRLGRSLGDLIALLSDLGQRGVGFQSLCEAIDTTNAGGRLIFHMMGALAEFERALIAERTRAGLSAARARGVKLGAPRKLSDADVMLAKSWRDEGVSVRDAAHRLGVAPSTLYRAIREETPAPD